MKDHDSIHIKKSEEGSLHRMLGVPEDQKIPKRKLQMAKHSKSKKERKKAQFAINMNKDK